MTMADLIGAYPHLHPFLYAEGDREASFGTLAELAASEGPQTKLMVAMNDAMQPVNEGTVLLMGVTCWSKSTSTRPQIGDGAPA